MNLFRCFAISFALSFAAACSSGPGTDFKVASPDGTLCVGIRAADSLTYTVTRHGTPVLQPSAIGLHFADGTVLGRGAKVTDARRETVERVVEAPFYRQARFTEHYNQLRLTLEGGYAVTFRVFDQGCAYRIETHLPGERTVAGEVAEFNFAGDPGVFAAYSDGLCNAYQSQYEKCRLSALGTEKPVLLPLAADCGAAGRVLVCEADLEAYPGMFLTPSAGGLRGLFAAVPDSCYLHERRCQEKVATRHDYIARVEGTRTYPWRILAVADEDRELPTNDLVYALAAENRIGDCSWVKPGKVAWEWWNDWGLTGVDFEPGINTRTYKAYIDFAADYGLEYVVLDEGWSDPKAGDVMSVVEQIDLPELVRYADAKGVGLMLWVVGNVLDAKLEEACSYYAGLGIRGFKVDFIDRDDQKAVELVYRLARVAAAHRLVLDIHGVYKPTGQNRTYPNIVNFESVFGLEELKWSRHAALRRDLPLHPYGAGPGGLYPRRLPQCHARRLPDRLPQPDEPGHAGAPGGGLRGLRRTAGDALRLSDALHGRRGLHALHRFAARRVRYDAGARGRNRRIYRHGTQTAGLLVCGRAYRLDAAHARCRPVAARPRAGVYGHAARRRRPLGCGARPLCALHATGDLRDTAANTRGARRRLRAEDRTG